MSREMWRERKRYVEGIVVTTVVTIVGIPTETT